jgi:polyisoprenoid-binding protein YceI
MGNVARNRFRTQVAGIQVVFATVVLFALGSQTVARSEGRKQDDGRIDLDSSRVYIHVGKVGLGHEHAVVGRLKSGAIHFGAKSEAGEFVFDMSSFAADTAEARRYIGLEGTTSASMQRDVNANMLGKDVLNVRKYPTATFQIKSAVPLAQKSRDGHTLYRLEGDFTLHGVKKPLKLDAEAIEEEGGTRIRGSFAIRQTTFGIEPFSKAFGAIGVADELSIFGEIMVARPAPDAAAVRIRDRK